MASVKEEMSTLTVRLERSLLDRFKIVTVRKRTPMSAILREFIEWYVEKEEKASERV